jgi:hypothetical protein
MLSQLVYVSNRKPTCTTEEIEKILAACKRNNPSLNITGVLLYSDKKFIQLVEGEAKVLMDLYDKIKKDPRHSSPMMISYNAITEKSFPSWHMGTKDVSKSQLQFKTDISADDKKIYDSILLGKEQNGNSVLNLMKKFF